MFGKPFNHSAHRNTKFANGSPRLLERAEVDSGLTQIESIILETILDLEKENSAQGQESHIVGVFLFGSWFRGDPHEESDVDLWIVRTYEGDGAEEEFIQRLKNRGLENPTWEILQISVIENDTWTAYDVNYDSILRQGYILVTPYPWVEEKIREARSLQGRVNGGLYALDVHTPLPNILRRIRRLWR